VTQYVGVAIDVYRVRLDQPASSGCVDAVLQAILAARLGRPPQIAIGPHGKPYLADGGLEFNVSHSGALALIAVSDGPIGVDVEQHHALHDPAAFARRFFTPDEAASLGDDPAALFRLWCRKEAWLKARGVGLAFPLDQIDVREAPPGWLLADLDVGPGYSAAVAREGGPAEIHLIDDSARSGDATISRMISR
jgi:4'-phosphopantetheinyl transferase